MNIELPFEPRCLWLIGSSGAGKSPLAKQFHEKYGWPILEAGKYARQMFGTDVRTAEEIISITAASLSCLTKDHKYFSKLIKEDLNKNILEFGHCILSGVRNPVDFADHFDPHNDIVIFLGGDAYTSFEEYGIKSIRTYLEFLQRCLGVTKNQIIECGTPHEQEGSCRHHITNQVEARVQNKFLGLSDSGFTDGKIIAVETYSNEAPTITWISNGGHIFCYLPLHAFGNKCELNNRTDLNCPSSISISTDLKIEGGGWCKVGTETYLWDKYITTVDWPGDNVLVHFVTIDGGVAVVRSSRFQVGGTHWNPPRWKKSREIWKI